MKLIQGVLFQDFYSDKKKSDRSSSLDLRNTKILNLHWHSGFQTDGREELPQVSAFNAALPDSFISFSDRRKMLFSCGVHCYLYDYKIESVWNTPSSAISCLRKYQCVIAPDFSVFVDMPRALNVWNIYRNRWVASYWQSEGINVIPSASWGNVDSFEYCFDGLPENSVISVGHVAVGRDSSYRKLYRLGIETLIERKHPDKLIVYGEPLGFYPETEVVYVEGKIQQLRRI